LNAVAPIERRRSNRFAINLEAQIKGRGVDAQATTVDISSAGVLLSTKAELLEGRVVEVHVKWPEHLKLVI